MTDNFLEFNLIVMGDSSNINTWSNLPYFFSKALIDKGVKLNRINAIPKERLLFRYYLIFLQKWIDIKNKVLSRNCSYDPCRDIVTIYFANKKIKKEIQKHSQAKLNIFLTFSFSSFKFSKVPVVHYCDQTYELFLNDTKKEINKRDLYFIGIEKNNLKNAHYIYATNKKCSDSIKSRYKLKNVDVLPAGINLENLTVDNESEILTEKNKNILFIGKGSYKRGVDILIKAFNLFNQKNANSFTLHIVGIPSSNSRHLNTNIKFHGYLNKHDSSGLTTYYHLLRTAKLFVMPMREGPIPGVIREAGLMYTPVIVTNIWHVDKFIKDGHDGVLVNSLRPEEFADRMNNLVKNNNLWEKLAKNAHASAKNYSWDHTAQIFLEFMGFDNIPAKVVRIN